MRRVAAILVIGIAGAVLGYCALYFHGTSRHRELLESSAPELAWLKDEFRLSDAEFQRISELHQGYLPRCEEMCRRIAAKNAEWKALLDETNVNPAGLEQKLTEASQLRFQCHTNMLHHFIAVSRQMPPEQGRRYLVWVQQRTFLQNDGMMEHR